MQKCAVRVNITNTSGGDDHGKILGNFETAHCGASTKLWRRASVLTMLYECHNENNPYDNEQIKADFNELYQQMNGMPLREMDKIVYPVCKLCRDHEKAGFIEGIRLGVLLAQEVAL